MGLQTNFELWGGLPHTCINPAKLRRHYEHIIKNGYIMGISWMRHDIKYLSYTYIKSYIYIYIHIHIHKHIHIHIHVHIHIHIHIHMHIVQIICYYVYYSTQTRKLQVG